ncbi:hypothetical protein AB0D49_05430 [Streptomyces sp. NPDC048290]|uniref:hypothetical protein n=1 Tax=Streptomyces sp. NPDC048290 TaxID=3155811 RepID=UPI00341D47DA
MSDGRAAGRADTGAGRYEQRVGAAPVRLECFRHEGPVLGNAQRVRGLDWLRAHWVLPLPSGGVRTVPVALPALCPGETAALPLPLPCGSGVRLRITTARDEPFAPRGALVCLLDLPPVARRSPGELREPPPVPTEVARRHEAGGGRPALPPGGNRRARPLRTT